MDQSVRWPVRPRPPSPEPTALRERHGRPGAGPRSPCGVPLDENGPRRLRLRRGPGCVPIPIRVRICASDPRTSPSVSAAAERFGVPEPGSTSTRSPMRPMAPVVAAWICMRSAPASALGFGICQAPVALHNDRTRTACVRTHRLTLPLGKGRIPSPPRSMQQRSAGPTRHTPTARSISVVGSMLATTERQRQAVRALPARSPLWPVRGGKDREVARPAVSISVENTAGSDSRTARRCFESEVVEPPSYRSSLRIVAASRGRSGILVDSDSAPTFPDLEIE